VSTEALTSPALTLGPLLVLTALFLCALLVFAGRSALRGMPHSERVEKQGGTVVLGRFLMEFGLWLFSPLARGAVRLGLHPDVFSWASLLLHLAAAWLLGAGAFGLGGWVLVFGAACDALDGAVARARGMASDAGEVLDAAVDRWAEMAVFFGLAWYYRWSFWGFLLAAAACAGSVMTSYARAKGEIYGIDAKMGLMQRHERAAWLATSTILSGLWALWRPPAGTPLHEPVLFALAVMAVLTNWTGWRRTAYVRAELRRR
jgi:CDP-diacylglycerol--glycerol-3-phosphate 3-phosphatidyltransferase